MKSTLEYIAASVDNASAQKIHAYARQVVDALDSYLDEYEIEVDFDVSMIKPDAYHVTLVDSVVPFDVNLEYMNAPDDVSSGNLGIHKGFLVLEVYSERAEDMNDNFLEMGAEEYYEDEDDEYTPYIALGKITGDYDEETLLDMVDYADDLVYFDMNIDLLDIFGLENREDDLENNEDNYI